MGIKPPADSAVLAEHTAAIARIESHLQSLEEANACLRLFEKDHAESQRHEEHHETHFPSQPDHPQAPPQPKPQAPAEAVEALQSQTQSAEAPEPMQQLQVAVVQPLAPARQSLSLNLTALESDLSEQVKEAKRYLERQLQGVLDRLTRHEESKESHGIDGLERSLQRLQNQILFSESRMDGLEEAQRRLLESQSKMLAKSGSSRTEQEEEIMRTLQEQLGLFGPRLKKAETDIVLLEDVSVKLELDLEELKDWVRRLAFIVQNKGKAALSEGVRCLSCNAPQSLTGVVRPTAGRGSPSPEKRSANPNHRTTPGIPVAPSTFGAGPISGASWSRSPSSNPVYVSRADYVSKFHDHSKTLIQPQPQQQPQQQQEPKQNGAGHLLEITGPATEGRSTKRRPSSAHPTTRVSSSAATGSLGAQFSISPFDPHGDPVPASSQIQGQNQNQNRTRVSQIMGQRDTRPKSAGGNP